MQFLAPTREALDEYLDPTDPDLEMSLMTMGDSAARIVPECVGLSLTLFDQDDLTFTLVAAGLELAAHDVHAAEGVASTLSLSVVVRDRVVGGIDLYASSADAFTGHHSDLAAALGASASGAVTDADLAFATRHRAEEAPGQLRDQRLVEVATGILAAREGIEVQAARERLLDAAARAAVSGAQAALVLIKVHQS